MVDLQREARRGREAQEPTPIQGAHQRRVSRSCLGSSAIHDEEAIYEIREEAKSPAAVDQLPTKSWSLRVSWQKNKTRDITMMSD